MREKFTRLILFILPVLLIVSCGGGEKRELLGYQEAALHIEADFTVGEECFPATVELEPPEYDPNGRMLARSARVTLSGNSIISGVSFEFEGGCAYVVSGVLKIPVEDEELLSGITDILSLFCISPDSFYESDASEYAGKECTRAVYTAGASEDGAGNRVEVYIDDATGLPMRIEASLGDRTISADISDIKAEFPGE